MVVAAGGTTAVGSGRRTRVMLYGIIPTFQPPGLDFGKVYAAYGAFIALSLLWRWLIDGIRPDTPSMIGSEIALADAAMNDRIPAVCILRNYERCASTIRRSASNCPRRWASATDKIMPFGWSRNHAAPASAVAKKWP